MFVEVDLSEPAPRPALREPDDFARFKVVFGGGSGDLVSAAAALAPAGELVDADSATLRVDAIRDLAGARAVDPDWRRGFASMLDYAQAKGWLDEQRTNVAVHCEWSRLPLAYRGD
jgi:hypothetical protein